MINMGSITMGNFEHISVEQAKAMMATKKVAVVDIRDESMFNLAHIPKRLMKTPP
jgi:rhodanese-related sulfurtransferase